MNRLTIPTALWLDETIRSLRQIKDDAKHREQCKFESGDNVSNNVYHNVKNIIDTAIDKINQEFEKL